MQPLRAVYNNATGKAPCSPQGETTHAIAVRSVQQRHWKSSGDSPQGETTRANLNPNHAIAARSVQQRDWAGFSDSPQSKNHKRKLAFVEHHQLDDDGAIVRRENTTETRLQENAMLPLARG